MQPYRNLNGDSGVQGYEIGPDYISVFFFGNAKIYTYSYGKAGQVHVENMQQLAINGKGLNSYINKYVKYLYD